MTNAIEMERVRKTFGAKVAVEGLDLRIPEGELVGLIGPNGAGKTTSIRMVMSILFPDNGRLSVLGKASAVESKDRIGYLPEERGVYRKMKVGVFLRHMGKLKGLDGGSGLSKKVRDWLERVELPEVEKKRCEELSKGMQQKVQFISSVLHEPDLLILDEPFSGLDPLNMRLLKQLILEQHREGRTVVFSTHVMPQAETMCKRIVMIHNGQKMLDNTLDEIRNSYDTGTLQLEMADEASPELLSEIPAVGQWRPLESGAIEVTPAHGVAAREAMAEIASSAPISRIEVHRPTLEDVFVSVVRGSAGGAVDEGELRDALRGEPAGAVAGDEGGAS